MLAGVGGRLSGRVDAAMHPARIARLPGADQGARPECTGDRNILLACARRIIPRVSAQLDVVL